MIKEFTRGVGEVVSDDSQQYVRVVEDFQEGYLNYTHIAMRWKPAENRLPASILLRSVHRALSADETRFLQNYGPSGDWNLPKLGDRNPSLIANLGYRCVTERAEADGFIELDVRYTTPTIEYWNGFADAMLPDTKLVQHAPFAGSSYQALDGMHHYVTADTILVAD